MAPLTERSNRLGPVGFVLAFGIVSMLADVVYEGARSITGPFLATLGASGALVGFVTGFGEAVSLVLRLGTGPLADRTRRYWPLSISGYVITIVAVPILAFAQTLWQASVLVVAERFGKAVRTPARDTMLSHAGAVMGQGKAFAVHEALDQSGAFAGPLLVALMVAVSGYQAGFGILAIPGVLALVAVLWVRRAVPTPERYDHELPERPDQADGGQPDAGQPPALPQPAKSPLPRRFWWYSAFTAASMLGFATFAVISYHLEVRRVLPEPLIPVAYAVAMGAAALAALGSGALYDRFGLGGLLIALPLAAAVPFLSFSTDPTLVWVGAAVWGAAMGMHESTLRAAVADLVPSARRGTAYGTFTAIYGVAWLAGSTIIGALYQTSITAVVVFTLATQALALVLMIPLLRGGRRGLKGSAG
ncbi:MFS transporter [Sinomonas terrae]|uniref:MFS transporter n=1 Tax=Sinomonas terrae TaxID=2908838 RepID=A0ABS9U0U3_9MICC|nr:MFS transporter [Sinomonas terrae]MCH6470216.1 MFS transporter [Sinomonas terrae]